MKNQNKTSKTVQFFLDRGLRCFGSLGSVVCFVFFGAGFGAGTSVCAFRFNKHRTWLQLVLWLDLPYECTCKARKSSHASSV